MHKLTTPKEPITLKEYGRNVQNLVHLIQQEPDKEKRTAYAKALIPIMVAVNPDLNHNNTTSEEKAWKDLFIIANQDLNIDAPYKPLLQHTQHNHTPNLSSLHIPRIKPAKRPYGRNILALLEAAKTIENKADISTTLLHIAQWILTFHKKNSTIHNILNYFKETLGNDHSPDLAPIKEQLEAFSPSTKHNNHRPKRFFKKRKYN